ncbi:MAG: glycosyltransferase family 1 protein [Candidatus Saccharimonadaceae bacterium]
MITILQVIGHMNRAGAETFLMNVLRNMNRDNFRFIFLCYGNQKFDYEDEILELGGIIARISDVKEVGLIKHINDIRNIIRQYDVSIVHAHTYYNSMFSIVAAKLEGVKSRITHSHNTVSEKNLSFQKKVYAIIAKFIISTCSKELIACGRDAGHALFYPIRKFEIVANGINLEDFKYSISERTRVRKSLGISATAPVLLHIGRFEEAKNHQYLIKIFNEYLKINKNAKLLLAGTGSLENAIKKDVDDLGIQNAVIFLGVRSDTPRLYSAADVFVFPSLYEGLPVTLVEAQANGLSCIISDTIDKQVKLNGCIEFCSLQSSPYKWAKKIDIQFTRLKDNNMQNGQYDIKFGISRIEKIYMSNVRDIV